MLQILLSLQLFDPDPIAVNSRVFVAFKVSVVDPAARPIWISNAGIVPWQNSCGGVFPSIIISSNSMSDVIWDKADVVKKRMAKKGPKLLKIEPTDFVLS